MTRDEILAMEPGRELDALIAEKVMGFKCEIDKGRQVVRWSAMGAYGEWHTPPMAWKKWSYNIPPYSTDISAAFEVVEKSINWGGMEIGCYGNANGKWFVASTYTTNTKIGKSVSATAHTAPEAICKAALLAVMEERLTNAQTASTTAP